MNIYAIGMYESPTTELLMQMSSIEFAYFSALGTWAYEKSPCKVCEWHWQIRTAPLLVQWEPSSLTVGDFSWDGPFGRTFLANDKTVDVIESMKSNCAFLPVEYVKPSRNRKRFPAPYPYTGPRLRWVQCTSTTSVDIEASGIKIESHCPVCDHVRYTYRQSGIVIRREQWNGQHLLCLNTVGPSLTYATEVGRRQIQDAGLTNIQFTEAGKILE